VVEKQQRDPYWPFPSKDFPLTPWTPEEQRKYAEEQLKNVPESPL